MKRSTVTIKWDYYGSVVIHIFPTTDQLQRYPLGILCVKLAICGIYNEFVSGGFYNELESGGFYNELESGGIYNELVSGGIYRSEHRVNMG